MRRITFGRRSLALLLTAIALLIGGSLLAACGDPTIGAASTPEASPPLVTPKLVSASLTTMAALAAADSNPITDLVGDPSHAGVWFWDDGGKGDTVYHVTGTGKLTGYLVSEEGGKARDGLAVSPAGTVWFGVNTTLIEVDPSTGNTQQWSIPVGRNNPDTHPSSDVGGAHAVDALAASPNGEVAVVMSNASSVEEFNPATASFSSLSLPEMTDEALSVTYSEDGSLCVGLSDLATGGNADQLLLVSATGATTTVKLAAAGSAWEVGPYSASGFVAGAFRPQIVSASGTVTNVSAPSDLVGSAAAPTPLIHLPNGNLLGLAPNASLIEFPSQSTSADVATSKSVMYTRPKVPCQNGIMAMPPGVPTPTPYPTGSMCPQGISDLVALDHAGNVWVTTPDVRAGVSIMTLSH